MIKDNVVGLLGELMGKKLLIGSDLWIKFNELLFSYKLTFFNTDNDIDQQILKVLRELYVEKIVLFKKENNENLFMLNFNK